MEQIMRDVCAGSGAELAEFSGEAEQDSPDLPDWQTSWRHLTAGGLVA
jgi:hypothetical protein